MEESERQRVTSLPHSSEFVAIWLNGEQTIHEASASDTVVIRTNGSRSTYENGGRDLAAAYANSIKALASAYVSSGKALASPFNTLCVKVAPNIGAFLRFVAYRLEDVLAYEMVGPDRRVVRIKVHDNLGPYVKYIDISSEYRGMNVEAQ